MTAPSRRTLARWLLVLLALYAVGWLLWNAWPALTPFLIGVVLAFLLLPLVNRLACRMPRWLAILTVYAGGIVLIVIAADYIIPPIVGHVAADHRELSVDRAGPVDRPGLAPALPRPCAARPAADRAGRAERAAHAERRFRPTWRRAIRN